MTTLPPTELTRLDALAAIHHTFPSDPVIIALGTMVREMLLVAGRQPNHLHVLDAMGLVPAITLGVAMSPNGAAHERVVGIEGDGGLLMGLSSIATIGAARPENLVLIVLDNGAYAATGGQRTAAPHLDLAGMARACGFQTHDVRTAAGLAVAMIDAKARPGPWLLRVAIGPKNQPAPYFLPDPVELAIDFRRYLASPVNHPNPDDPSAP